MTQRKRWKKMATALLLAALLALTGCGGGSGNGGGGDDCDCEQEPLIEENGLVFTFEGQQVRTPANVSVFFKMDTVDGLPVTDLRTEDFLVYEDGDLISQYESQQTVVPMPGQFRSDTLLLLDLSGSILGSGNLDALKAAAREFIFSVMEDAGGGMRMSIWWFDGARSIHPLVEAFISDANVLLDQIDGIAAEMSEDPSTNLYGAVIDGIERVEAQVGAGGDVVSVGSVVIFTDGADQAGWRTREEALTAVETADPGLSIYTIGLRGEIDEAVLTAIGRDGSPFADDVDQLVPRFEEIAQRIREDANSHYKLEYCSPKRTGAHDLMIAAALDGLRGTLVTCFCAEGFEGGCTVPLATDDE
jgi:hypothetical protein